MLQHTQVLQDLVIDFVINSSWSGIIIFYINYLNLTKTWNFLSNKNWLQTKILSKVQEVYNSCGKYSQIIVVCFKLQVYKREYQNILLCSMVLFLCAVWWDLVEVVMSKSLIWLLITNRFWQILCRQIVMNMVHEYTVCAFLHNSHIHIFSVLLFLGKEVSFVCKGRQVLL